MRKMKFYSLAVAAVVFAALLLCAFSSCTVNIITGGPDATYAGTPEATASAPESTDGGASATDADPLSTQGGTAATGTAFSPTDGKTAAIDATPVPTNTNTAAPQQTENAESKNVALSATVKTSSTTGEGDKLWGWSADFINDGIIVDFDKPSRGWSTPNGANPDDPYREEWVLFTLEKQTAINSVKVYPTANGAYFPVDFEIQVSSDGSSFRAVAKITGNDNAARRVQIPVLLEFDTVTVKYVKFVATHLCDDPAPLGGGFLCQVAEIEIFAS